jgi:hypothetical protein
MSKRKLVSNAFLFRHCPRTNSWQKSHMHPKDWNLRLARLRMPHFSMARRLACLSSTRALSTCRPGARSGPRTRASITSSSGSSLGESTLLSAKITLALGGAGCGKCPGVSSSQSVGRYPRLTNGEQAIFTAYTTPMTDRRESSLRKAATCRRMRRRLKESRVRGCCEMTSAGLTRISMFGRLRAMIPSYISLYSDTKGMV